MAPFIHPRAAERTKSCSAHNRPAPEAVTSAHADVEPTGAAAFRAFLRHRSTLVPFLRQPSLHSAARQPAGTGSAQDPPQDLVEVPPSAATAAVRGPRVRADRSPAHRAAVPPASAPLRRTRAVAHDVEAQFSTGVTPALGAGHPVDRVHRSSVPGGNPRFSPKISEVKATDQQRPAQAPRNAHTLDAQARDLVEVPPSAATAAVRCPRVRADRSPRRPCSGTASVGPTSSDTSRGPRC